MPDSEEKSNLISIPGAEDLHLLLSSLAIPAVSLDYYEMAFTHSSCNGMSGIRHDDYERLEFLGDALIGMVVSELCFVYHPEMEQGDLSILKAEFIKTASEAEYARKMDFPRFVRVGVSFRSPVSEADNLLEDIFEAFIGALLLDQGREYAYHFVRGIYEKDIREAEVHIDSNPKSTLQEAMQAEKKEAVTYRLLDEQGPAHARVYTCGVYFENELMGQGTGTSKKDAETAAAASALHSLVRQEVIDDELLPEQMQTLLDQWMNRKVKKD